MKIHIRAFRLSAPLAVASLLLLTGQTQAAPTSCDEAVVELARRYGIVPTASAGANQMDAEVSIRDSAAAGGGTAPPQPGAVPETQPADPGEQAAALLGSALDAAARGDEPQCSATLEEARAILASPMPGVVTPESTSPRQ